MTDKIIKWESCYEEVWKGIIVDEAFAHPAKFSRALITRIYSHMLNNGWIAAGDTIVDPFGGVALGGWSAANHGIMWVGIELELHFTILAKQNILLWSEGWCCCDNESQSYLRKLRETIRENGSRSESSGEPEIGTFLQSSLQKHLFMQGEEIVKRNNKKNERKNTVEQGETLVGGNERKTIDSGWQWQSSDGKERTLERGTLDQSEWVCGNTGKRETASGTYLSYGTENMSEDLQERSCSSQERGQTGQQNRKLGVDDNIRTYENASSKGDKNRLRYCKTCGKLVVPFPKILNGDSRRLIEVITQAGGVVSSPPFMDSRACEDPNYAEGRKNGGGQLYGDYGTTPGQLGAMKPGNFEDVV
jgi:hypothetical protein